MTNTETPGVSGEPRAWLRAEGVAAFLAGLILYSAVGGEWIWFLPLLFVPDISMVGYLAGPALGATIYNLVHNWAFALVVFVLSFAFNSVLFAFAGAVLIAHVGLDRALGYGLKYPTAFQDTHLGRIGRHARDGEDEADDAGGRWR